mgnify:FL=1
MPKPLEGYLGADTCTAPAEEKLRRLSKPSTSHGDSGYGSSRSVASSNLNFQDSGIHDEMEEEEEEARLAEQLDGAKDEEVEAGEGLLWNGGDGATDSGEEDNGARTSYATDLTSNVGTPQGSPSEVRLIPPTPSQLDGPSTDAVGLTYRVPSSTLPDHPSRRISFNSSVRISGGIRPSRPRHSSLAQQPDLFSPLTPSHPHPPTERSPLVSTHPRSRSSSPSVHNRTSSSGSLIPYSYARSTTPTTSGRPSRSSSPCSSIYAPLHAPSSTCPSTTLLRLPQKQGSFRAYLTGREEEEEQGYHQLVEAQRRKKARIEKRKEEERPRRTVWETIREMLKNGVAGAGRRGGGMLLPVERETGRSVRRRGSMLSVSSVEESEEEPPARKGKTSVDVMFGEAPGRWASWSWWSWKSGRVVEGIGIGACLGRCWRGEERGEDRGEYEEV